LTDYSKKLDEPSTGGQLKYIETMLSIDITFCTGPAGTGKTYLAVAVAVSMLKKRQIRRIVLARPAVEAGEKLGFLPGDIQAKVNPYLRPLFDALEDMMDFAQMRKFMEMDYHRSFPWPSCGGGQLTRPPSSATRAQKHSGLQM
jgi:phosphate starvation-inducible PhoH-like protein